MTTELKSRYTFRLNIDRDEDAVLDVLIGANDTPDEIGKAEKNIRRLLTEYTRSLKGQKSVPVLTSELDAQTTSEPEAQSPAADQQQDEPQETTATQSAATMTTRRPDGAKGLLRLHCPECGNTFGTFLREYQTEVVCKCGHPINLTGQLGRYHFTCPYCQNEGWGKTNSEDPEITVRCKCGEDVELRWDSKAREYQN